MKGKLPTSVSKALQLLIDMLCLDPPLSDPA